MSSSGRRSGCRSMRSEAWLSMAAFVAAAHALVGLVREIGGAGGGVGGERSELVILQEAAEAAPTSIDLRQPKGADSTGSTRAIDVVAEVASTEAAVDIHSNPLLR